MSAAPQISGVRLDGQWAWKLAIRIFERCPPYLKATARGVYGVAALTGYVQAVRRLHDGRRPPQHRHIPALEGPKRRAIASL